MAITFTNLTTSSSTTDATSWTTASVTPAANTLILAAMWGTSASTVPTITASGAGLTWVSVTSTVAAVRTLFLFRALGASPTTGAVTFTGDGTTSMTGAAWAIVQVNGADTSGTNGSGAIVQSIIASPTAATSGSVNFTTTPTAGNAGFGAVAIVAAETVNPGTGWSLVAAAPTQATPNQSFISESAAACPTAVSATWTSSVIARLIGCEILPAGSTPSVTKQSDFATTNRARFRASVY